VTSGSSLLEALYDFTAEFPDQQLSFRAGEQFTLISKDDPDWWDVQRIGAAANGDQMLCGAVPGLYMREIPQQGAAKAEATKETTKDNTAVAGAEKNADKPAEKPVASAPSTLSVPADTTPRRQSFKAPTRASVSAATSPAAAAPAPIEPESAAAVAAPVAPTPLANAEPVVAATPHAVASSSASPSSSSTTAAPTDAVVATHRTLYAFTATAEGQLSFEAGAALRLLTKEHEAWWRFSHITSGMQGLVAATYVEEVSAGGAATPPTAVSATASLPRHVALYTFSATADGQVSLVAGDVVSVLDSAVGPGWWLVRNERTNEQGLVPLNYLEPKPSDAAAGETDKQPDDAAAGAVPAAAPTTSNSEELGEAVALYDFVATEPTQLSVSAGEVVRVLSKPADAWFVARSKATGKEGSVPENYVRFQPAADAGDAVGGVAAAAPAAAPVSDEANGERRLSGSKAPPPLSKEQVAHVETVRRNSLKEAAAAASASSAATTAAPTSAQAAEVEAASGPAGGAPTGTTGAGSGPPSRRSSAGSGGPPPLSKELTEHVKRLSISHAATVAAADDGVAAAKASASAAVPVAASSGGGATHRAAFALAATAAGQLSFDSGALLRLVSKEHDAWWRFVLVSSGEEGLVPANYVTELTTEEMQSGGADGSGAAAGPAAASAGTPVGHAALYDFSGTAAGQLSVTAGEVVSVLDKTSVAGWWRVRKASGEEGLVPENYMQSTPVDEAGSAAAAPSAAASSSAPSLYDVVLLFDYQSAAGVSPPLSLSRGALLSVTDDSLADWLTVRSDASEPAAGAAAASTVSGLVPSSYTARVLHRARALYAFAGDDSKGLLSLEPDQRVLVTVRSDDCNWLTAWTVGRTPAQTGLVPATYIEQS
jgi:uncharacterized membrane protein